MCLYVKYTYVYNMYIRYILYICTLNKHNFTAISITSTLDCLLISQIFYSHCVIFCVLTVTDIIVIKHDVCIYKDHAHIHTTIFDYIFQLSV